MQTLVTPLEDIALGEKTYFSAEEAAGQTSLSCMNSDGFASNDFVILGRPGSENAEIIQISSTSTGSIVTGTTKYLHYKDEPITEIFYNQRKFYRSTSQLGSFTHMSTEGSPIAISVDEPDGTQFEDVNGTSTSWYKATYYNSCTYVETPLADSIAVQANNANEYTSIYKIRREAGFEDNAYVSVDCIAEKRLEAKSQIDGTLAMVYQLPLSSIPALISHINTLLAAGLLLQKEYGVEANVDIMKSGQPKIIRAEELLQKIVDGQLLLVDVNGSLISKQSGTLASGSNTYDSNKKDKGELFNVSDENFQFTDPTDETADSARIAQRDRSDLWSQK